MGGHHRRVDSLAAKRTANLIVWIKKIAHDPLDMPYCAYQYPQWNKPPFFYTPSGTSSPYRMNFLSDTVPV